MSRCVCTCVFTYRDMNVWIHGSEVGVQRAAGFKALLTAGDEVECKESSTGIYITAVYPRKNELARMRNGRRQILAANIDNVFILTSLNSEFNIARLERYCVIALESRAKTHIVLTKNDLFESESVAEILKARFPQIEIIAISSYVMSTAEIEERIYQNWNSGESAVFIGSSGVGKSTLINRLLSENRINTFAVRDDDKGRHTTTARHLYFLKDGRSIIDTPGLRAVGVDPAIEEVNDIFMLIHAMEGRCRFSDCTHTNEPGCAVREAINNGEIDEDEFARYCIMKGKNDRAASLRTGKGYEKLAVLKDLKKKRR